MLAAMKIIIVVLVLVIVVTWLRGRRPDRSASPVDRIVVGALSEAGGTGQTSEETKPSAVVQSELESIAKHGFLRPDEILVEVEHAMVGWDGGAMFVTDQRVLFSSTPVFRRKPPKLISIEYADVGVATVTYASDGQMSPGVSLTSTSANAEAVVITHISGGPARPLELARSIEREKERWRKRTAVRREPGDLDTKGVLSRTDFVAFVRALSEHDPGEWENPQTCRYLESLAAWVEDWSGDLEPSWGDFARALVAATEYE
jgi:hypothetical protein